MQSESGLLRKFPQANLGDSYPPGTDGRVYLSFGEPAFAGRQGRNCFFAVSGEVK